MKLLVRCMKMKIFLVRVPAFDVGLNERYENISVKKIPQNLLKKCEYDVENYDLKISERIYKNGNDKKA